MKIYELQTPFTFGKYKGKTMENIVKIQPSYINWCSMNLDHCILPQHILDSLFLLNPEFNLSEMEENKRMAKELKWDQAYLEDEVEEEIDNEHEYHNPDVESIDDLEFGDWDYDPMNPAHNRGDNPWIDVFGPREEAEAAYWNTD